jgi:hypothetical protein
LTSNPTVAERRRLAREADAELVAALEVPASGAERSEDLDLERDTLADREPARLEHAVRAAIEGHQCRGRVLDVDRPIATGLPARRRRDPAAAVPVASADGSRRSVMNVAVRPWTAAISPTR